MGVATLSSVGNLHWLCDDADQMLSNQRAHMSFVLDPCWGYINITWLHLLETIKPYCDELFSDVSLYIGVIGRHHELKILRLATVECGLIAHAMTEPVTERMLDNKLSLFSNHNAVTQLFRQLAALLLGTCVGCWHRQSPLLDSSTDPWWATPSRLFPPNCYILYEIEKLATDVVSLTRF